MNDPGKVRQSVKAEKSLSDYGNRAEDGGLECPKCGCRHFRVIYTTRHPNAIERRRACRNCGYRVSTREQIK
jgi:C4-type Zn-finger protein